MQLIIKNIGKIVTGQMDNPMVEVDALYIAGGRISKIGSLSDMPGSAGFPVVDANGLFVCPGLIDAHTHPGFGDFIPQFKAVDWVDSYVNGGVTSMVSAGGIHVPGFPDTASGVKALAILQKQCWDRYRPTGAKVYAGTVMLARGLKDKDFEEMAQEKVTIVGEVGMGNIKEPDEAKELVKMAKACGFKVMIHSGGASVSNGASYTADNIFDIGPDVVCHLNGAPTPMSDDEIHRIITDGDFYFEVIPSGNVKKMFKILNWALEADKLDRVLLGTNAPSIAGFSPVGLWMIMAALCSYGELKPVQAIAMATGNVSKCYGLENGFIKEGCPADLLLCDTGTAGSAKSKNMIDSIKAGDLPSVAMVIIDGQIMLTRCRNTAPPSKQPIVV